eukprot:TRINITY_DN21752_c0_g1_i1.p1 TRINITY_DN21752_c0_g1~~TRINITY_DN21752_c0_g1_i1.p1  ORF type:complete len:199 (+),score=0.99 TRINITY_DN21752_c0_g1_i1:1-597(+)
MTDSHPIQLVHENGNYIVVNKPSGLLCVPGLKEPDNLFDRVKQKFPAARTVHRLGMSTSGLVLFALSYEAQKALSHLFEKRKIKKKYRAKVAGLVEPQYGEIHSPIICDWPKRPRQKIDWLNGKLGSTFFRVIERVPTENATHLWLIPHTGRTHQLRIHMWQIGHPILGDELYCRYGSEHGATRLTLLDRLTIKFEKV